MQKNTACYTTGSIFAGLGFRLAPKFPVLDLAVHIQHFAVLSQSVHQILLEIDLHNDIPPKGIVELVVIVVGDGVAVTGQNFHQIIFHFLFHISHYLQSNCGPAAKRGRWKAFSFSYLKPESNGAGSVQHLAVGGQSGQQILLKVIQLHILPPKYIGQQSCL